MDVHSQSPATVKKSHKEQLLFFKQKTLLFEMILERLDVGIHVIDTDQNTLVYNSTMAKLESQDVGKILGKKLLAAMPYLKSESSTLIQALQAGRPLDDQQQTYINAGGKEIVTVNSTAPLFLDNKIIGAMEIAKDITYIKTLSETIASLQQNLSNKKRAAPAIRPFRTRYTFSDIIGDSEAFQIARTHAFRASRTQSNVLIYGETGTGKELFAQSIHSQSPRKHQPFLAINCAALPEQLLEGLLFGTAKGSFTGAIDRPGFFEQAEGGTLLLDEINSMHMDLQAKLLRVLQEHSVRRIGAQQELPIDVRIIATMNVEPGETIAKKQLRSDLFYRLGVVSLHIPPLREHLADIQTYVAKFIEKYNRSLGLQVKALSPIAFEAFYQYSWPGNVRELEHAIEGAMNLVLSEEEIQIEHFPALFRKNLLGAQETTLRQIITNNKLTELNTLKLKQDALGKTMICNALEQTNGNITKAAAILGLTRQLLQYKLKKYQLK
jgi:arginine utilization regulatory protein